MKKWFVYRVGVTCVYCLLGAKVISLLNEMAYTNSLLITAFITLVLGVFASGEVSAMPLAASNQTASRIDSNSLRSAASTGAHVADSERRLRVSGYSDPVKRGHLFKDLFIRRTNAELITTALIVGLVGFIPYIKYFL